jgi:hypothetical protein
MIAIDTMRAVVTWLGESLPAGFGLREVGPGRYLVSSNCRGADDSWELVVPLDETDSTLRSAIDTVLSEVQDYVAEETTSQWPPSPGASGLPLPDVEIDANSGRVRAGYRSGREWILSFDI